MSCSFVGWGGEGHSVGFSFWMVVCPFERRFWFGVE